MKQYGFRYNNFQKMQSFIYSRNINKYDNILVQVFTGVIKIDFIENVVNEVLSILPQAEIIGTTTGGEILKSKSLVNSTVISITVFRNTKVKSKLLNSNNNEYELGRNIVKELVEEDTKAIILFAEGLLTDSFNIIKGIQSENSSIIVCGGKAGDNGCFEETFVFTREGISQNGVAAVSLTGKELNVTTEYSLGWSTIGKSMTITKASNNRVYTIDNVKTVDIYKKYLGEQVAEGLPMSATEFPLIVKEDGIKIAKVPCACNDDGSLSFLSNFKVNDKVKFGYGNVNMLIDNSIEICERLAEKNVEALFVYSCFVRKSFMQEKISFDINPLSNIAPAFGFFTYGEFFTANNSNRLLNVAMTILGISEGNKKSLNSRNNNRSLLTKSESPVKSFFEGKDFGVIKAFTNLVDEATKEIQETNKILQKQKCKVEQMNSITKSILQINSEMISSGEFDSFIQGVFDKIMNVIEKGRMGSIFLVENNRLCYKASKGYVVDKIKDLTYDAEDLYKYNKVSSNDVFNPIILRGEDWKRFLKENKCDFVRDFLNEQQKELLTCCIEVDGQVAGIINVFNTNEEADFNEDDKSILKYICYDIAIALKNFSLLKNVLYMSRYDCLTGVYNRSYFREILDKILNKSKLLGTAFIICGLDLNDFKIINDTYGHDKGDEILMRFAKVFKSGIGKEDILGRIGGDEFIVIFVNKDKEQVMDIIDKISVMLKNYNLVFNGNINNIRFSYGLAEFSSDSDDIEELLKIADKRMYEKKREMKN